MEIPRYSLIRILVDGFNYKAGELARYSHQITHSNALGQTADMVLGHEHSINAIHRPFVGIYDGQFEVIPGHQELRAGDEVYISSTHPIYAGKPFTVLHYFDNGGCRIKCEDLETYAHIGELIPVYLGNKYNKHVLERGD